MALEILCGFATVTRKAQRPEIPEVIEATPGLSKLVVDLETHIVRRGYAANLATISVAFEHLEPESQWSIARSLYPNMSRYFRLPTVLRNHLQFS
jgi:hypothetical protein